MKQSLTERLVAIAAGAVFVIGVVAGCATATDGASVEPREDPAVVEIPGGGGLVQYDTWRIDLTPVAEPSITEEQAIEAAEDSGLHADAFEGDPEIIADDALLTITDPTSTDSAFSGVNLDVSNAFVYIVQAQDAPAVNPVKGGAPVPPEGPIVQWAIDARTGECLGAHEIPAN